MMWHDGNPVDLEAIPSGAAALGPPLTPSPRSPPVNWEAAIAEGLAAGGCPESPPGDADATKEALAALRRCRQVTDPRLDRRPQMQAALDPEAYAYASATAAAASRPPSPCRPKRVYVPPLAIPPPRESTGWRSGIRVESEAENVLCSVPDSLGVFDSEGRIDGMLASWSKWLTPLLGTSEPPAIESCCGRSRVPRHDMNFSLSRSISSDFDDEMDEAPFPDFPDAQHVELGPGPLPPAAVQVPMEPPAALGPPSTLGPLGPLGVPVVACRQRQTLFVGHLRAAGPVPVGYL